MSQEPPFGSLAKCRTRAQRQRAAQRRDRAVRASKPCHARPDHHTHGQSHSSPLGRAPQVALPVVPQEAAILCRVLRRVRHRQRAQAAAKQRAAPQRQGQRVKQGVAACRKEGVQSVGQRRRRKVRVRRGVARLQRAGAGECEERRRQPRTPREGPARMRLRIKLAQPSLARPLVAVQRQTKPTCAAAEGQPLQPGHQQAVLQPLLRARQVTTRHQPLRPVLPLHGRFKGGAPLAPAKAWGGNGKARRVAGRGEGCKEQRAGGGAGGGA